MGKKKGIVRYELRQHIVLEKAGGQQRLLDLCFLKESILNITRKWIASQELRQHIILKKAGGQQRLLDLQNLQGLIL